MIKSETQGLLHCYKYLKKEFIYKQEFDKSNIKKGKI